MNTSKDADRLMGFCVITNIPRDIALVTLIRNWAVRYTPTDVWRLQLFFEKRLTKDNRYKQHGLDHEYRIYPD